MANPYEGDHVATTQAHADDHGGHGGGLPGFLTPDVSMLVLTWVTFFVVLGILSKFAFKPILKALQDREDTIRKSLDDAKEIEQKLADIEISQKEILDQAKREAAALIEETRQKTAEHAHMLEKQAQEKASGILEQAQKDIEAQKEQLKKELKSETIDIAIRVSEQLIKSKLDSDQNRNYIDGLIKEL